MNTSRITTQRVFEIPTRSSVDWSLLQLGVSYEFRLNVDFDDFTVMRNRAHNAARRLRLKALTHCDMGREVLVVEFRKNKNKKSVSRKRAK
jgi:hypothetical protein